MKLDRPKEWWMDKARLEGDAEVAAGPQRDQRLAELRALGPTPDDWDGPGSIRPATLEHCWHVIEELDAMLAVGVGAEEQLSRLVFRLSRLYERWQQDNLLPTKTRRDLDAKQVRSWCMLELKNAVEGGGDSAGPAAKEQP